jgi:hypothetical protein
MTIKVWIVVDGEEIVGDEVVFPVLPSKGTELRIQDRDGRKRMLTVQEVEMYGMNATIYPKALPAGGQLEINLHCEDQFAGLPRHAE